MAINLQQTRARLERKRDELRETLAQLRKLYAADSSEPSNGVEDTEEVARETAEREEEQSIFANQQRLLAEVEQALKRLDEGTYGRCSTCGGPIPEKRLEALPWAARDVVCESAWKEGRSDPGASAYGVSKFL